MPSPSLLQCDAMLQEGIKLVGGLAWAAGIILLFVAPTLAVIILLAALALSVRSIQMTRERRHKELLDAQNK